MTNRRRPGSIALASAAAFAAASLVLASSRGIAGAVDGAGGGAIPPTGASSPSAPVPDSAPAQVARPEPSGPTAEPSYDPFTPAMLRSGFVPVVDSPEATPEPLPAGVVPPSGPEISWTASQLARLRGDLDRALRAPVFRGAHVGLLAVDSTTGKILYASRADDEFQPASTTKLVVGSAALDRLGVAYRYRTVIGAVGSEDGVPVLVIRGGGDPLLTSAELDAGVVAASKATASLPGAFRVDASRYETVAYPRGWVWDDFGQDYAARASAASVEENVEHLHVAPASSARAPAVVSAESGRPVSPFPPLAAEGACGAMLRNPIFSEATTGPAGSERDVDVTQVNGCDVVVGTIPLGSPSHSIDVAVVDPAAYVAEIASIGFRSVSAPARDEGRDASAPPVQTLWTHVSPPLGAWLGPNLWIPSDNFVAEMLLDELGFAAGGAPGSTEKGLAYERTWLESIGVDLATVTLADGSGLSQYDRLTPADLVRILQHDWNGPERDVVLNSLPIGGVRGTIESLTGTPLTGRIFAKTGNMSHVHGLAGYLSPRHHGAVTFAFLVDDCNPPYAEVSAARAAALSSIVTAP